MTMTPVKKETQNLKERERERERERVLEKNKDISGKNFIFLRQSEPQPPVKYIEKMKANLYHKVMSSSTSIHNLIKFAGCCKMGSF